MELNKFQDSITLNDHAFLLVLDFNSNPRDYINAIFSKIIFLKEQELSTDLSLILKGLIHKQYDDLIWISLRNSTLKKENVIEIKEKFSYPSLNSVDIKFYVLENIENSSNSSLNSLLKFLEEPSPNTYAIFTTTNKNSILNTIISRCKVVKIESDANQLEMIFSTFNLEDWQKKVYKNIFYTINEFNNLLESDIFKKVNKIIYAMLFSHDEVEVYESWESFKTLDNYEISIIISAISNYQIEYDKKSELNYLLSLLKNNLNKNLIFFKLYEILKK